MKKKVLFSILVIVAVIAITATATWAYFSYTTTEYATVTTALIGIGDTYGFPLAFSNILPGETLSKEFRVRNTGNRAADFYAQLVGDDTYDDSKYMNYCLGPLGDEAMRVSIMELSGPGGSDVNLWIDNMKICNLYPGHANSQIRQIGDSVPGNNGTKWYRVSVTLATAAGNEYMDKSNTDIVNLIAVQEDAPAPKPDKDSFYSAWPTDTGGDDDPNY